MPGKVTSVRKDRELKTYIAMILDSSGSMISCKQKTIEGYNNYLRGLKKEKVDGYITLIPFNSVQRSPFYVNNPLKFASVLTYKNYTPEGTTPLFDTIIDSIKLMDKVVKEDKDPKNVLVVIITDGYENASEHTVSDVRKMIKAREAKGWTFVYLGANQDAFSVGATIGTQSFNTANYMTDSFEATFNQLCANTATYSQKAKGANYKGMADGI